MFCSENRNLKKLNLMPKAVQFIVKNEIVKCKTKDQVKLLEYFYLFISEFYTLYLRINELLVKSII
jgi:hypothetical protein